jgi:hypothetical protein
MDYFAVMPDLRCRGVGREFLAQLPNKWDKDGIIIECEMPDKAKSTEEYDIRKRRINFYIRNGAVLYPIGWRAFGVDYNLLWLPINKAAEAVDIPSDIRALYGLSMPIAYSSLVTRVYDLE